MARESTVRGGIVDNEYIIQADSDVDDLRSEIWKTIHREKGDLPWADVSLALGVVQYELAHHADEFEDDD